MVNLTLVNENAFGGKVMSGPVSQLENYLDDPNLKFSGTGKRAFLKVAKTPVSYYNKQPDALQKDLLTSMKSELKFGNINFLIQNNEITFAAPENEIEMVDPMQKFEAMNSDWELRRQDLLYSAVNRYIYKPQALVAGEYTPTMFVDIPVLYAKNIKFEVGLYKVICSNGLLDKVSSNDFSLNPKSFSNEFFTPIVGGVLTGLTNNSTGYQEFLNYIRNCPLSVPAAESLVFEMMAHRVIPQGVSYFVLKYFDLVKNNKIASDKIPATITNYYDLMDVLTFYAQKTPSIGVQSNVEKSVFQFFYTKYQSETKVSIQGINIKNFVPGEQTTLALPRAARRSTRRAIVAPAPVITPEVSTEAVAEPVSPAVAVLEPVTSALGVTIAPANETLAQANSFIEAHETDDVTSVDTPRTVARKTNRKTAIKMAVPNIDELI